MQLVVVRNRKSRTARRIKNKLEEMTGECVALRWTNRYNEQPYKNKFVVNFGCSNLQIEEDTNYICNGPVRVGVAKDKLRTFTELTIDQLPIIEVTTLPTIAENWKQSGRVVFSRMTATGHSGQGIVLNEVIPGAEFYSVAPKEDYTEYRALIFDDEIIGLAQKRKLSKERLSQEGLTEAHPYIRTRKNGWVFARNNVDMPEQSHLKTAIRALETISLEFGAVDFLVTASGEMKIIEINSAPGMEGSFLENFCKAVIKHREELL